MREESVRGCLVRTMDWTGRGLQDDNVAVLWREGSVKTASLVPWSTPGVLRRMWHFYEGQGVRARRVTGQGRL